MDVPPNRVWLAEDGDTEPGSSADAGLHHMQQRPLATIQLGAATADLSFPPIRHSAAIVGGMPPHRG